MKQLLLLFFLALPTMTVASEPIKSDKIKFEFQSVWNNILSETSLSSWLIDYQGTPESSHRIKLSLDFDTINEITIIDVTGYVQNRGCGLLEHSLAQGALLNVFLMISVSQNLPYSFRLLAF